MAPTGMNEHGLYAIYDAWHVPFWQTKTFFMLLLTIGLLILCVLIGLVIKRYRSLKIVLSPWEHALLRLESLKKNNQATADKGKEFYGTLTSVLKRYLHERYGLDKHEKTDEEFLRYLEKKEFSSDFLVDLHLIFSGSTTIKFANMQAIQTQIDRDLALAISFVSRTIPASTKTTTKKEPKHSTHITGQRVSVEK